MASLASRLLVQLKALTWPTITMVVPATVVYYVLHNKPRIEKEYLGAQLTSIGAYPIHVLQPGLEVGIEEHNVAGPVAAMQKAQPVLQKYLDGDNLTNSGMFPLPLTATIPLGPGVPNKNDMWSKYTSFLVTRPLSRAYKTPDDVIIPTLKDDIKLFRRHSDAAIVHRFEGPCSEDNVWKQAIEFGEGLRRLRVHPKYFSLICDPSTNRNLLLAPKNFHATPPPYPTGFEQDDE